MKLYFRFA